MQIGIGNAGKRHMMGVKTDFPEPGMLRTSTEHTSTGSEIARARIETLSRMLMAAAKLGKAEEAARLLDMGANPNATDDTGCTPLQYAALYNSPKIAELLLKHNANPNAADCMGWTPLYHAACNNYLTISELLVKHGASPNKADRSGWTPLHYAVHNNNPEIAELFFEHGANLDLTDNQSLKPPFSFDGISPATAEVIRKYIRPTEQSKQLLRTADEITHAKESETTWIEDLNEARRLLEEGRRGSAKKILDRIWLKEAAVLIKEGNSAAGYERFRLTPNKHIRIL